MRVGSGGNRSGGRPRHRPRGSSAIGTGTPWNVNPPEDVDGPSAVSGHRCRAFPPLTDGTCLPGTTPSECLKVILGCSRTGRGLPNQLMGRSEGMPWAHVVLSWMPHQIPRAGERCSPVYRQSPTASSGVLRLPRTFTHPHTITPARCGRCTADLGARRCEPAPSAGRSVALRCWLWRRVWRRNQQCRRGWYHGQQHGRERHQGLRQ